MVNINETSELKRMECGENIIYFILFIHDQIVMKWFTLNFVYFFCGISFHLLQMVKRINMEWFLKGIFFLQWYGMICNKMEYSFHFFSF